MRRLSGARVLAVATSVLAVGSISAFGWGLVSASPGSSAAGVQSEAATGTGTAMARPAPQAGRPCSAADLQVSVGGAGAYRGSATQELRLTNRATNACFIPGAPSIEMLFADGSQQGADPGQFATSRVDLQPGQSALLLVGAPGTCASADPSRSKVATRMALALTGGGASQAQGAYLDVQCGGSSVLLFVSEDATAGSQ